MVANRARELVGIKWIHQGRDPSLGLDCVGLAIECAKAVDINVDAPYDYPRLEPQESLLKYVLMHCECIGDVEMEPGDLIVMAWANAPSHLAIYVGDDWMVHAYERYGVCYQQMIPYWKRKVDNVYRLVK